jgi:two-component system LytT family sensor kinase
MEAVTSAIRRYATLWLAWTAAGLFYFTQDFVPRLYRNEPVPWQHVFVGWMAAMYICAVFTPALLWLGRRWPIEHGSRAKRVALHFGFSAVFSAVTSAIEAPVLTALGVFPAAPTAPSLGTVFSVLLVHGFHGGVIRYWAVIGLQAVYRSHQTAQARERESLRLMLQSSELGAQLSAAQLSALKMQLQPHFLFNTLSAIMSLVRQQKTQHAETMIARLSDLLRLTLDDVDTQEVPLWRELEFLRLYLSIEQVRFEDRLRVRIAADPDLSDAFVPHMALQPVVENVVRHGLGQSEQGVCIDVNASRVADTLVLTITDDGPGSPSGFEGRGIGLANTRSRLARLYGPGAALVAENVTPRGVRVTISLPFHAGRFEDRECG